MGKVSDKWKARKVITGTTARITRVNTFKITNRTRVAARIKIQSQRVSQPRHSQLCHCVYDRKAY